MYCNNCGKKIENDSNYCPFCGKYLINYITSDSDEINNVSSDHKKIVNIPFTNLNLLCRVNMWSIIYGIWLLLNLYWLFTGEKSGNAIFYFMPFSENYTKYEYSCYDITEFIFYALVAPYVILKIIRKINNTDIKTKIFCIVGYVIWSCINILFLFKKSLDIFDLDAYDYDSNILHINDNIYYFTYEMNIEYYDITEFIVYVFVVPVIIYGIVTLIEKILSSPRILTIYVIWLICNISSLFSGEDSLYYSQEELYNLIPNENELYNLLCFIFFALAVPYLLWWTSSYINKIYKESKNIEIESDKDTSA